MLTEKVTSDKISLGYWGYFARAKEIFLQYFNFKICQITLFVFVSIFISVRGAYAGWSAPVRISEPGGCQYPQILAQGDTLHVVFMHLVRGRGIGYIRSTDAGLTWCQEIGLCDTVNTGNNLFPKIMRYNQRLLVVWTGNLLNWPEYESVHYSLSTDDGLTWSLDQRITGTDRGNIVYFAASNYDSLINIMFNSNSLISDSNATFNIRSTNFGASWPQPSEIKRCSQSDIPDQASMANLVHYSWAGNFNWGDTWETYYLRSADGGLTWSSNISISSIDNYASQLSAVTCNEVGNPTICWMDGKYAPYGFTGDILMRASTDFGDNWGYENQVTTNHKALDSDICWANDTICIVWVDDRFAPYSTIYYSFSSDSGATWSPENRLVSDSSAASYPAMASSNDKTYVVFYEFRPYSGDTSGLFFTWGIQEQNGIGEENALPAESGLYSFPNPFNSSCIISYSLKNERGGNLTIFNIQGQKIRSYNLTGKEGKIIWDAKDAKGNSISSGVYFAKASASHKIYSLELLYLK